MLGQLCWKSVRCTSGLHAYSQGKLNYLGSSSEKTWPPALTVLFPQSYYSTEETGLRGRLKIQKCRLSTATSKVAFLGWWWCTGGYTRGYCKMSQNSHTGNALAIPELFVSPSGLAWLLSTPASRPSQGKAPEPRLTQFQSLCCLFLSERCGASPLV